MATRVTTNDLLDAIRAHGKAKPRKPEGEGWYTLDELAAADGVSLEAMRHRLKLAKRNGVEVETATGSVVDQNGDTKRASYYRLKR